ncbi:MAG: cysteinyl-tRNA synthetase [Cellvibrionaceae bacterium]|jgi:cysteinyl-tRNA synthetase
MSLKIYNTLERKKVDFKPIEEGKISLYVCGMTVYDYCHIGHARILVSFDVITRFLRSQAWSVEYVRNITDIDDKIFNRANENGEKYTTLTQRFIDAMHEDEEQLNVLRPDKEPRATGHVNEIINMVEVLINKDFAYQASNGDVYYRVRKFENYGRLSGRNIDEQLSGARIDVELKKEDPFDFVLWKMAKEGEAFWESPWGNGRPGWHIECSAMTKACLGDNFDIHGGGPDLPFPHHENEIAQSEAANGCQYANYWMHAGAVRVDGEKMSKSLDNFFTIREVLKKYHPEVVRFLIVSSHYRSAINYSEDNLIEAKAGLDRFYQTLKNYSHVKAVPESKVRNNAFLSAMNDDFNTPQALSVMYELLREVNSRAKVDSAAAESLIAELKGMADILAVLQADPIEFLQNINGEDGLSAEQVEAYIEERLQAKLSKNYKRADELRQLLTDGDIVLEDSPQGTTWRRK